MPRLALFHLQPLGMVSDVIIPLIPPFPPPFLPNSGPQRGRTSSLVGPLIYRSLIRSVPHQTNIRLGCECPTRRPESNKLPHPRVASLLRSLLKILNTQKAMCGLFLHLDHGRAKTAHTDCVLNGRMRIPWTCKTARGHS